MGISVFLKGIVVGLIVAVPVGPIGVLCLCRTLTEGRVYGIISGLGAATADAVYGFVAVLGVSYVSQILTHEQIWFGLLGGLVLGVLGMRIFFTVPVPEPRGTVRKNSLLRAYFSALFLTFTNPMTILSFAGIFAALGVVDVRGHYLGEGELILGVFTGSALWWVVLGGGFKIFGLRLDPPKIQWVYRISGSFIGGLGLLLLLNLVKII
ncbi:LysE family translocator [Candidatus Formimonas warabiya]|uniref:LysE family translocator n=1 Tax=Formimonas warabiya TaxID=1761012 RepID=A0A3G1KXB2_FORW1|nr:LysE family transporter [Candidatus Formimonas warabiya]ATW27081.1 hypothetical protein DCMF_22070 [Candidatus Formimonas warabiya]